MAPARLPTALPQAYLKRMETQLGGDYAAYLSAMEHQPRRALRVNGLKLDPAAFCALADFPLTPAEGMPDCFFFPNEVAIGRRLVHVAGLCYVQEPSAQRPVELLDVRPGMTVLDLCASPGGKSGQIAQKLAGRGLLIANEAVHARILPLLSNLERLGVSNAVVTNLHPDALCGALAGRCDRVLVDAPCSGEGMFRREPDAAADWSEAHVAACARRQAAILQSAAQAVRPGGALVYATCTFSEAENESVVSAFVDQNPAFHLRQTRRLYPHTFPGEGQFMALLGRDASASTGSPVQDEPQRGGFDAKRAGFTGAPASVEALWSDFCKTYLTSRPAGSLLTLPDGRVNWLPEDCEPPQKIRFLRAGVPVGTVRAERFIPDHALFLALGADAFMQRVALDGPALASFLSGEQLACPGALSGWCAVTAGGFCIGFGKAVDGALKNHLPKGLRLWGA